MTGMLLSSFGIDDVVYIVAGTPLDTMGVEDRENGTPVSSDILGIIVSISKRMACVLTEGDIFIVVKTSLKAFV